jgi:hypothetical protein
MDRKRNARLAKESLSLRPVEQRHRQTTLRWKVEIWGRLHRGTFYCDGSLTSHDAARHAADRFARESYGASLAEPRHGDVEGGLLWAPVRAGVATDEVFRTLRPELEEIPAE